MYIAEEGMDIVLLSVLRAGKLTELSRHPSKGRGRRSLAERLRLHPRILLLAPPRLLVGFQTDLRALERRLPRE